MPKNPQILGLILMLILPFGISANERPKLGDIPHDEDTDLIEPEKVGSQMIPKKTNLKLGDIRDKKEDPVNPAPISNPVSSTETIKSSTDTDLGSSLEEGVAESFFKKGMEAMELKKWGQAEAYFDRVLILKPDHQRAQDQMNLIMKMLDDYDTGEEVDFAQLKLLQKLKKEMIQQMEKKQWEEAYGTGQKILAIDPDDNDIKNNLNQAQTQLFNEAVARARKRHQANNWQAAIDAYQVALTYKKDPSISKKIVELRTEIKKEQVQKSAEIYVKALAAHQEGKSEEAASLCEEALGLDPDNFQAQRMLDRLKNKGPQ